MTKAVLHRSELDLKYLAGVLFPLCGPASMYLLQFLIILLQLELTCHSYAVTSNTLLSVVFKAQYGYTSS